MHSTHRKQSSKKYNMSPLKNMLKYLAYTLAKYANDLNLITLSVFVKSRKNAGIIVMHDMTKMAHLPELKFLCLLRGALLYQPGLKWMQKARLFLLLLKSKNKTSKFYLQRPTLI